MTSYSKYIIGMPLYQYQSGIANYVLETVRSGMTNDIVVTMARQSGKNETSAHLECAVLSLFAKKGGTIIKAAPTWSPQIIRSKHRLESRSKSVSQKLKFLKFGGREGYIWHCGNAEIHFLSGRPTANVVGDTASLLMEIDEAQDFDTAKFDKDFSPMRSSTGAPAVFYGTPWTDSSLLSKISDNIKQNKEGTIFEVPWQRVADENEQYGLFVEREIKRLGIEHPIIRTQYRLLTIAEAGRLLSQQQLKQIMGTHPRKYQRDNESMIVAGLDFAGADENASELSSLSAASGRDSVALSIGEVNWVSIADGIVLPFVKILDRYEWVNVEPTSLHTTIYNILENKWAVDRLHCDATGIGEVPTAYLAKAMDSYQDRVVAIKFDSAWNTHSRLAFQFLAAVNGSRLLDYAVDFEPLSINDDTSPVEISQRAWWQRHQARLKTRPNKRVKAEIPESLGHDDLLVSEMLMLDAAHQQSVDSGITI